MRERLFLGDSIVFHESGLFESLELHPVFAHMFVQLMWYREYCFKVLSRVLKCSADKMFAGILETSMPSKE
jgi:hypothetical protein